MKDEEKKTSNKKGKGKKQLRNLIYLKGKVGGGLAAVYRLPKVTCIGVESEEYLENDRRILKGNGRMGRAQRRANQGRA